MKKFYSEAGGRIREVREANRYTREKLAEIANVSPEFLYEIESGRKGFSAITLFRIVEALSTSYSYILSGKYTDKSNNFDIVASFDEEQMKQVYDLIKTVYKMSGGSKDDKFVKKERDIQEQ